MTDAVLEVVRRTQLPPSPRVLALCEAIRTRHPAGVIEGFLFYGSGLRDQDDPDKMLDLYVLVGGYRALHGPGARAALNLALPPDVYTLAAEGPDGAPVRSKYSVLSLPAFERRATEAAFLSSVWGRFAQRTVVVGARDAATRDRMLAGLAACVRTFAREAEALQPQAFTARAFWTTALAASYRTELRAEDAARRAASIVEGDLDRYEALTTALYGPPDEGGLHRLPGPPGRDRWALRRTVGKPLTAARVVKAAFTFEDGVDYALDKLERHSGVRVEVTEAQRRHPVLWSPVLLAKVLRSGAWR